MNETSPRVRVIPPGTSGADLMRERERMNGKPAAPAKPERKRRVVTCSSCGKPGHQARTCPNAGPGGPLGGMIRTLEAKAAALEERAKAAEGMRAEAVKLRRAAAELKKVAKA